MLSKQSKGEYSIIIWDIKKYNRKTDSLLSHKIDTVIVSNFDDSNMINSSSIQR